MGQHHSNPFSDSYRGEVPAIKITAEIDAQVVPSDDWLKANPPDDEGNRPQCPPESWEVRFIILGMMMLPSALEPNKAKWPHGQCPMVELDRMPWSRYLELMIATNPQLGPAATIAANSLTKPPEEKS